uniref:sulfatase family protein n=1 Tax=uncultured Jannaschia sp. TaxID=293347 RepID=UPI002611660D
GNLRLNGPEADHALTFIPDHSMGAVQSRGVEKPSRVTYRQRPDYREAMGAFIWEADPALHPDNFVGDLAVHWLNEWRGDDPFFLQIGLPGPHPPYDPTPDWLARYEGKVLPAAIRDYDLDTQPAPLCALREHHADTDHDGVVHLRKPTDAQLHRQRAHYYANVSMIDAQVGNILSALEARGVLDDTIVIFTSDHGDCLNDHGHIQKWTMYEASVHVPALVWAPGRVVPQRVAGLTSLFDFGPTILEYAGVSPPDWMEAKSLQPLLSGEGNATREAVFAEHANDMILDATEFVSMVRTERWKLVMFLGSAEGQLFDMQADPKERDNLWDLAEHRSIRDNLVRDLADWRIRSAKRSQGFLYELVGV